MRLANVKTDLRLKIARAVKIITERATQSAALDLIVQDIGGKDIDRRDKALTSLLYLRTHKVLTPTYNMFKALIDCLSGWLPAVCPVTPYRSQPERDAVKILNLLLQHNVTLALQAGIVVRWLSHCCFDPDDKSEARRKQAIQEMRRWHYNDVDMCSIIITLFNHEQAREELLSHGLWDRDADKKEASDGTQEIIWQVQGNIPDLIFDGVNTGPIMRRGRRVREESIEEQALRRRRREAMVLGQDGRAVERDDIIGQDNEPRDEDLEQRNAVDEAAQAPAEGIQTWWNWRPWSILRATLVEEF